MSNEPEQPNALLEVLKSEILLKAKTPFDIDVSKSQCTIKMNWRHVVVITITDHTLDISGNFDRESIPLERLKPVRLASAIARYVDQITIENNKIIAELRKNYAYAKDEKSEQ
jgi:hypothetical protein